MSNIWQAAHRTLLQGRRYRGAGAAFKLQYEQHLLQIHTTITVVKEFGRHLFRGFYNYIIKKMNYDTLS